MKNFIKDLVCEYYEFVGFFIRRNIPIGSSRIEGQTTIDVLAYHYSEHILFHIEKMLDGNSWDEKIVLMSDKFGMGELYYSNYVNVNNLQIQRVTITGINEIDLEKAKKFERETNSKLLNIKEFMKHIKAELQKYDPFTQVIPESFPLLRAIQLALTF